jgi:hypothetical protein
MIGSAATGTSCNTRQKGEGLDSKMAGSCVRACEHVVHYALPAPVGDGHTRSVGTQCSAPLDVGKLSAIIV